MKIFLLFCLLCVPTAHSSAQENLREIDLKVHGVGSGASYATVLRNFGKPLRSKIEKYKASEACSTSAETHLTLSYSGLEITLLGDGRGKNLEVYSIELTSKKWIASGVRIGATSKYVIAKFGKPNSKGEVSGGTIFYYVTKGNLGVVGFYFRNNMLARIAMTETLC